MRFLSSLIKTLLLIIFGYWLAVSQIANNTIVGDSLDWVMSYLPMTGDYWSDYHFKQTSSRLHNHDHEKTDEEMNHSQALVESSEDFTIQEIGINDQLIRQEILDLTNQLRQDKGLQTLELNTELELAGNIRAEETVELFSHTRPNGQDPFTVLTDDQEPPNYDYRYIGENLGMATYHRTDEYMAQLIFDGWMNSQGHYDNIVKPEYSEMGVGVTFDGEFLYITQFFGDPML